MKRISTYIVTLVLALAGSSCSDYLDKEYDASLSEKKVFNNQNLTRRVPRQHLHESAGRTGATVGRPVHRCFT